MIKTLNNVKTVLLLGGMMGLFLAVGSFYGQQGMIMGLVFGGLINVVAWFFSDKIAIAAMSGQEVTAETPGIGGALYQQVDELRQRAGLPMPRVFVCPHDAPNAFATGRSPAHASVAVTEGALRLLTLDELRGVLGHELAHVKNRDTLTSCIAATIAGILAFFAQWGFYLGGGRGRNDGHPLAQVLVIIFAAVGAAIIKAMISRSREYVADHDGAEIAGTPDGLIGALQKLEMVSQRVPLNNPNPAQNNLFIVEPLTGGTLMNLFATHPPMEKRLEALTAQREEMRAKGQAR